MTRCVRCLFLLLPFAFVSFAQSPTTPPQQAPPAGVATLHTGTKLVVVDVVVRDKSGHPIHGLTRNDFLLAEAGKPQAVSSFEEYAAPATPPALPPMPALPPGQFTNFTPVPGQGPLNVLLIDGVNTPLADQSYLRQQLSDYVKHVPPGARIAIFGLADHLYMLQGFTSDPRQLQAILGAVESGRTSVLQANSATNTRNLADALADPSAEPPRPGSASALMKGDVQSFLEQISVSQTTTRIQQTIEAFDSLGHWLVNFPGRKNLIWFSGAFPLGVDPTVSILNNNDITGEDSDEFRAMTNLLTRAQVSVYPVDPRGAAADSAFAAGSSMNLNQRTAYTQTTSDFFLREAAEHTTMQTIASDTGGEPFYNRNNLTQAVGDAIEDGANYYTISYAPSEKKTGGEWRSIRIELAKSAAHKGAQLSYRRGYFADDLKVPAYQTGTASVNIDPNTPSVESRLYSRAAMLHGAPTSEDIPFTTRVLPASTSTEDTLAANNIVSAKDPMKAPYRRYDVDCAAAARYITLAEAPDGHRVGAVQAVAMVYDSRGKLLNAVSRTLRFNLTPEEYAQFQRLGFREHLEISAPAKGESFFRIGIEEGSSGRIGTVEVASSAVSNLPPPEYAAAPGRDGSGATPQPTGTQ
jgi:VWFA-related protein